MIAEFINSPVFIAVLGAFFTLIGWGFTTLFSKFKEVDFKLETAKDKITQLEFSSVEMIATKVTLSNFGSRLGSLESEDAVLKSNLEQIKTALNDEKAERQQSSQVMLDILSKLGELTTQMAVITTRLENIDRRLTRLEAKVQ
jgi:chromosome segregation ATPase